MNTKAERQKAIIDYLARHDGWHSLAVALDIPRGSMSGYMSEIDVARRPRSEGGGFASLRWAESQKTAPGPQAAPAPDPQREQSAEVAAEVNPVPPLPAADDYEASMAEWRRHFDEWQAEQEKETGGYMMPPTFGTTELEQHVAPDSELYVLQLLADLDAEARERVLQFAVAKWWLG